MMSDYELDVLENILREQKKTNSLLKELIELKRRDSDPHDISDLIHAPCKKMSDGSYGL